MFGIKAKKRPYIYLGSFFTLEEGEQYDYL